MANLFELDICRESWWGFIKQSVDAFESLIKSVFSKHGLVYSKAENLSGVNAVFKVGDKVIKIFAPVESGCYGADYYEIETEALNYANNVQVASPKLLFKGIIHDKYIFRYIIMEFIDGQIAERKIASLTENEKRDFSTKLRDITNKLNINMQSTIIPVKSREAFLLDDRWQKDFSEHFCNERIDIIKEMSFDNLVYVHGDIHAKNLIIDSNGTIYLADFAESSIAPYYCEWYAIVFLLFKCNPVMMTAYFGDYRNEEFYSQLTKSILIYGALAVKEICEAMAVDTITLTDISKLKELVICCLEDGNVDIKY